MKKIYFQLKKIFKIKNIRRKISFETKKYIQKLSHIREYENGIAVAGGKFYKFVFILKDKVIKMWPMKICKLRFQENYFRSKKSKIKSYETSKA